MSLLSRQRHEKLPTVNARRELRQHISRRPTRVFNSPRRHAQPVSVASVPFGSVTEPGHLYRYHIPQRHYGLTAEPSPKTCGAFGGVTRTERTARKLLRKLTAGLAK